jgi:hypothetical protein
LLSAWALVVVVFFLVAGPSAMVPGYERYALCLIGPTVLLFSRGAGLAYARSTPGRRLALAAASLSAWLLLADYQANYFGFIGQTGARAHQTFRTAPVEPKQAALRKVLNHRNARAPACGQTTWIVTTEHWNYWPLRYLAGAAEGLRVAMPEEAEAAADFASAQREGRVWYVEFAGSQALAKARAGLGGRTLRQWRLDDFGGRPVLWVLHAE